MTESYTLGKGNNGSSNDHLVKIQPCETTGGVVGSGVNQREIYYSNVRTVTPLMTSKPSGQSSSSSSSSSALQPHIVLNNVNNTLTFSTATLHNTVMAGNNPQLNRPIISSCSSSIGGESKVIYTTLPFSRATTIQTGGQQGMVNARASVKAGTFVSLQDVKSYPNFITTVVDSTSMQPQQVKTSQSLAIPLKQGMRIIAPHSSSGGQTLQQPTATLKRTNSELDNPIITKVIITNTSKPQGDQDGGSKVQQKPGTYLLTSPSKQLTFATTDSMTGLGQPIVVKPPANTSKKILLKPSGGVFNFNKFASPEKKSGEQGGLAAGTKLHCIKLVTSTPPKCNSEGNKMVIGKVKPITELTTTSVAISQPTVVSIQKQVQLNKPGQRVLIPAPTTLKPANQQQQPTVIRTLDPNLVTFTPQSGTGQSLQNFVMVPTQYLSTATGTTATSTPSGQVVIGSLGDQQPVKKVVSIQPKFTPAAPPPLAPPPAVAAPQVLPTPNFTNGVSGEVNPNDPRPRKPCNCTKSQCLKLYCDCFANGEFCNLCNCTNCYNNLDHEEERQKAIKACLDRNPLAFHPKIGKCKNGDHERRHTKGCNCKRSGCLKNYCECYEAKILCTALCKCVSCKNYEDSSERKTLMHLADAAEVRVQQQAAAKTRLTSHVPLRPALTSGERLPFALITDEVIEASSQCLLAQAEDGEKSELLPSTVERLILEEFGRCLLQIIDCSNKTKN